MNVLAKCIDQIISTVCPCQSRPLLLTAIVTWLQPEIKQKEKKTPSSTIPTNDEKSETEHTSFNMIINEYINNDLDEISGY